MHDRSYRQACEDREAFRAAWNGDGSALKYDYEREARANGEEIEEYEPYVGSPEDYRPDWADAERTCFQWYETVSEGTPVSPVFDTMEGLARWLMEHNGGTYERWLANLQSGGWCPSGLGFAGGPVFSGEEAIAKGMI